MIIVGLSTRCSVVTIIPASGYSANLKQAYGRRVLGSNVVLVMLTFVEHFMSNNT